MSRTSFALTAAFSLVLAGGLLAALAIRPAPTVTAFQVAPAASGTATPAADEKPPYLDPEVMGPVIKQYLLAHPEILQDMSEKLQAQAKAEQAAKTEQALSALHDKLFNDPNDAVVGNPDGDVTLVEMFDYNCTYCRSALPDLAKLIADDPNLRVVLKDFPILSQGSLEAAKIALAVHQAGGDYWAFHTKLFSTKGQVDKKAALDAAKAIGLDPAKIDKASQAQDISKIIQQTYTEAQALDISGTPAYIIGGEVIPGAIGANSLKQIISNVRKCGSAQCDG